MSLHFTDDLLPELRQIEFIIASKPACLRNAVIAEVPCENKLINGDVLLRIDGTDIECDGTVRWRKRERVNFDFVIQSKFAGDNCALQILRDGKVLNFDVVLKQVQPIIPDTLQASATYVYFAGLVLVPLSLPFLETYEEEPEELTVLMNQSRRTKKDQELVVLSSVLSEEINMGYEDFEGEILTSINGVDVLNLKHAHELLYGNDLPKMIVMHFGLNLVCFMKKDVDKYSKRIMKRHFVPTVTNLFDKPSTEMHDSDNE